MRKTRWSALLAVGVAIVTVAALPGAASADGKPVPVESVPFSWMPAGVRAKMFAQAPLSAAAKRIQQTVDQSDAAGYAGIGMDGDHLTLWWKGTPPPTVRNAIADVRQTAPVRVVQAAHSRAELVSAADTVGAYIRANPESLYHGVEVAYDGSGLVVDADQPTGRMAAAAPPVQIPAGIPLTMSATSRPQLTGRLNDSVPYWAGGRIQNNDNAAFCTAGWPVYAKGAAYMLTAGHCGRVGGSFNNGNDSLFFGTGAYEHVDHDVMLVSASVAGRMWDGGVGSGEFTKGIVGWEKPIVGQYLCSSGATSGAVCNFRTSNTFQHTSCFKDVYGNQECHSSLVLADQLDGLPGSRGGDSGGPVFSLSGSDKVIAKGTITGVRNTTQLMFQDFGTAITDLGITSIIR